MKNYYLWNVSTRGWIIIFETFYQRKNYYLWNMSTRGRIIIFENFLQEEKLLSLKRFTKGRIILSLQHFYKMTRRRTAFFETFLKVEAFLSLKKFYKKKNETLIQNRKLLFLKNVYKKTIYYLWNISTKGRICIFATFLQKDKLLSLK